MRIDKLRLENFKCFEDQEFSLHENFTLFVGENGSGKTSILSGAAVALGIWETNETVKKAGGVWRKIYDDEVRLIPVSAGDRGLFTPAELCMVSAEYDHFRNLSQLGLPTHTIRGTWSRSIENGRRKNDSGGIAGIVKFEVGKSSSPQKPAPLLAFYGSGRAWVPSNDRGKKTNPEIRKPSRWDGYYDCLQERIRLKDLDQWFRDEAAGRDDQGGWRPGYKTVQRAILNCLPGAEDIVWDHQRLEICLRINGALAPFSLLSDGQKTMTAMVADMAIRAVTLNSFLFDRSSEIPEAPGLPIVLAETPGVVLIDELDVHLHPKWQRQVVSDLRRTFPKVQFICTSHSPQVIGEVGHECLRIFDPNTKGWVEPNQSFGMDSNWILKVLMGSSEMDTDVEAKIEAVRQSALNRDFAKAENTLAQLRESVGNSKEIQYAASTLERVKILGR